MLRMRAFVAVFLLFGAVLSFAQENKEMTVTVKETQIRSTPSYLGKILAKLAYGAKVTVLAVQSGWVKVNLPSGKGQGWVNLSALKEYKGELKAGGAGTAQGASSSELSAAGKGFNKEIEEKYQKDQKLDYTPVNTMEKYTVTPEQVAAFLKTGGLDTSLGGAE
jgi:uncharacterized protein YgiM (DUF1202 family)